MRKNKRDLMKEAELNAEKLNIPAEEIWTYKIDGLQAPRIIDKSVKPALKFGIIAVIVVAIALSIFFSIRAVSNDEFKYAEIDSGIEFVKYTNPGTVKEVTIDYADDARTQPVTEIHEYAFNCDEKIETVYIGKDVRKIDGKSFYSCWSLKNVFVDDANPYYCDIDGVLYNKELTEVIYYPSAHNTYLVEKIGYKYDLPENGSITNDDFCAAVKLLDECLADGRDPAKLDGDDAALMEKLVKVTGVTDFKKFSEDYNGKVGIYVLPSTVTKIGKLAFAYSDITEIYIPEGVKEIGTLGFFKAEKLKEIYSYTSAQAITDTTYENVAAALSAYRSLPNGLETIGSDAFTYDRCVTYMYVPASVKEIGHHAFFNMAFKSGDKIEGVAEIAVAVSEEEFRKNAKIGDSWLPKLGDGLFKKNVDVVYSAERQ